MPPLFKFFGSKHKMSRRLGRPERDIVIEPFAGSAGYSCHWQVPKAILCDIDPIIVGVWRYLIKVKESEIMGLRTDIDELSQLKGVCQEAKWLIGFWFNTSEVRPSPRRSNWARDQLLCRAFWGDHIRLRIARNLKYVRQWRVIEGNYWLAPDIEAHWHIDPPYQRAGYGYKYNALDYAALAQWCRERRGFVQVCEDASADWLPFVEVGRTKGKTTLHRGHRTASRYSIEAVFEAGERREGLFTTRSIINGDASDRKSNTGCSQKGERKLPGKIPRRGRSRQRATPRTIAGSDQHRGLPER